MADKGMPDFIKKKIAGSSSASSDSASSDSASSDSSSSDSASPAPKGKMTPSNPLAKWAAKKKG